MSKVTIRRGETLPENMVQPITVVCRATSFEIKLGSGDLIPFNAVEDSYTVEVPDDPPPQAYLIVPCEKGKGTHRIDDCGVVIYTATPESTHKQIPCALTLEDLGWALGYTEDASDKECRVADTIAAWDAVPQPKEADR